MNWIEEMVEGEGPDSLNTRIGHDTWNLKEWLRKILTEAEQRGTQEALAKVEEWVKEKTEDLETLNDPYTNCNPRCHDSGKEAIADDLLHYLQQLKDNKEI